MIRAPVCGGLFYFFPSFSPFPLRFSSRWLFLCQFCRLGGHRLLFHQSKNRSVDAVGLVAHRDHHRSSHSFLRPSRIQPDLGTRFLSQSLNHYGCIKNATNDTVAFPPASRLVLKELETIPIGPIAIPLLVAGSK